jgi:DNA-binding transcriptional LysR family regulator
MPHIAVSLMPAVLGRFASLCPLVRVEVIDNTPSELLRMVEDGALDAAYGPFFRKESGVERLPIFPTRLMLATGLQETNWPDFSEEQETWRALQGIPLICFLGDTPIQRLVEENLSTAAVTPGKRTFVGHLETAIAMAEAGFGVAVVPSISAAACQRFRVRLHPILPIIELPFYCITRAGRASNDTLTQLSTVFEQVAQAHSGPTVAAKKSRKRASPAA